MDVHVSLLLLFITTDFSVHENEYTSNHDLKTIARLSKTLEEPLRVFEGHLKSSSTDES